MVVLFLADVGLGLLTRVAPALNAFSLGFPLKILLTLVLGRRSCSSRCPGVVVRPRPGRPPRPMLGVGR